MRDRIARRVAVERALRAAIDQERLLVHFQPIVQLPAGRVLGFEALARWPASDVLVPPSEFVPIAEENGLIVPLGAWVLDQACAQVAAWRGGLPGGADLYVSVNLSARQVRESDVVDVVADTLDRHGLPGAALCLEITESVMLEDTVGTAAVLGGLRELGVGIAIDDFGTGFSSLAYLKRFPVGRLKIDRAFVSGLDRAGSDESLVAAVVAMAGALGLATVAEGVETEAQAARLVDLGCYEAQGYRFGRPAPAGQIPELVARRGLAASSAVSIARPA
jgi:diguanylate cyclase